MPLFARATTRRADLPSLTASTRSRPPPPPRAPTPTPPLSSASHTSTTSSSGPPTPPATDLDLDARASQAWSLLSDPLKLGDDGGGAGVASLGSSRSGNKLRTARSRSKSRSREAGDERGGLVGRFFKRIASRKSLRGDAGDDDEQDGGECDKIPPPQVPSLSPRLELELLELPSLGAAFELSGPAPPPLAPEADPSSLAHLVSAAADKVADPSFVADSTEAPAPPKPAPAQPARDTLSRLKKRLSRLALPSSRPLSIGAESADAYGEASASDPGSDGDDEDEALSGHAWLSAPLAARPAALTTTPPTSPLYAPPPPPLALAPRSPFLARDYDPTVERLFAHARARLAAPSPALTLNLSLPSSTSTALAPPFSTSALPGPASTHPLSPSSSSSSSPARPRRTQPLRTLLAHHTLRTKLQRGVTRGDRAELARTSTSTSTAPIPPPLAGPATPSLAPPPPPTSPLQLPLPRLREWAARPAFVERAWVHTAGEEGPGAGRARLRGAPVPLGRGTRAWLDAMAGAGGEGEGGSAHEPQAAPARRPAREAPPREPRRGPEPAPVGAWLVVEYGSRPLPAPPVSASVRAPLGPTPGPGPLLLRQLARQDAEARLTGVRAAAVSGLEEQQGRADAEAAEDEDEDEDERPLATLPRSPQRTSRLLPPAALGPPVALPSSPRSRPMIPTPTPSPTSTSSAAVAHDLAAAQRKTARLEAELGRLRAREVHRQREEDAALRERAARDERARGRRADEQRRRTRAMGAAPARAAQAGPGEARRRETTTGPGAAAGQIPHSRSCGAYLAVPLPAAWGPTAPSPAPTLGLAPPLYHQPLHALSAPDLQALQRQQALGRPLAPQQRYSLAPPPPSGAPPPPPPPRPQRNSLRPPPHPLADRRQHPLQLPHSRSTPNIALLPAPPTRTRSRSSLLAPPPPSPPGPGRRASYRPPAPLVTLEAA